jgi:hypothetical protein
MPPSVPPVWRLEPNGTLTLLKVQAGGELNARRAPRVMALTGDQWIAIAGVSSGAAVGLAGLAFGYFNGRSERQHAEGLARGSRLHDQRLAAYAELARYLERERLYLQRTEPMIGPQPDPPGPLDDD